MGKDVAEKDKVDIAVKAERSAQLSTLEAQAAQIEAAAAETAASARRMFSEVASI